MRSSDLLTNRPQGPPYRHNLADTSEAERKAGTMNAAAGIGYRDPSDGHDLSWLPDGPHTLDVLDILPPDRRYELMDGTLIIGDAQPLRHQQLLGRLATSLGALLSGTGWTPLFSPGFSRNPYNYRVPDVAVCQAEAAWRNEKHAF
jgi:Putative restriction endonuclease